MPSDTPPPPRPADPGVRYTALVNPIAGGGRAIRRWAAVEALLTAAGARTATHHTRGREDAVAAAGRAAARGEVVVAAGGDGLVRDAVSGTAAHGALLGVVPGGRGNDLARVLGLPDAAPALARLLLALPTRVIDVLEVAGTDTVVPGNVYAGVDSVATAYINGARRVPPLLLYRLAPARALLTWRPPEFRLRLDGGTHRLRAHAVVVGNSGAYGHGLRMVPSARLDDGTAHVLTVGDGPRRQLPAFLREARDGRHVRRPEVAVRRAREVTLDADRPVPVCADGDYLARTPVTVRVRPAAQPVIAPPPAPTPTT